MRSKPDTTNSSVPAHPPFVTLETPFARSRPSVFDLSAPGSRPTQRGGETSASCDPMPTTCDRRAEIQRHESSYLVRRSSEAGARQEMPGIIERQAHGRIHLRKSLEKTDIRMFR